MVKYCRKHNFSHGSVSALLSSVLQIAGVHPRHIRFREVLPFGFVFWGFFSPAVLVTALSNTLLELFICLYSLYSVIPVLPWLYAGLQPGSVVEQGRG